MVYLITQFQEVEKPNPPAPFPAREGGDGNMAFFWLGKGEMEIWLSSLFRKGKIEIWLPSPFRGGAGGGVKLIIATGESYEYTVVLFKNSWKKLNCQPI